MNIPHVPVLKKEIVELFKDIDGGYFIDCTLGYGGHSEAILETNQNIFLIGCDQDSEAIEFSSKRLQKFKDRILIEHLPFSKVMEKHKDKHISGILADIGVSSLQLDKKERGFGFKSDKLDMRMDNRRELTACDILNRYSKIELERIFLDYGEMRDYKKIARIICEIREKEKIISANQLSTIMEHNSFKGNKKIHPATLIFQALRIEVNDELGELERLLDSIENFRPSARVAIISFHSLEDRIVKQRFKKWTNSCICPNYVLKCTCGNNHELGRAILKKPIEATIEEISLNPRSRSAKLRAFDVY